MKHYVLIDRSGSMADRWDEVVPAIRSYAATLKKGTLKIWGFDSAHTFQKIYDGKVKAYETPDFGAPGAMTPLYDAVGQMYKVINEDGPKKCQIVIVTDGHENASMEVTHRAVLTMTKRWEELGYDVVFMGADFTDAKQVAMSTGVSARKTVNMTRGNMGATMMAMGARASAYNAGDVKADDDLGEDLRKTAGDS